MYNRNKALLSLTAAALLLLPFFFAPPSAGAFTPPPAPAVQASGVAILDENGNMVYGSAPHARYPMASTTKMMTALVAVDRIDLQRKVVIDVSWDEIPDSSVMYLTLMDELTIEDLLYGMMLPSGNDAARAIARAVSGDEYRFVKLMNEKARALGLADTHYMNPHGRDQDGHYSSAYDLARTGYFLMQKPVLARIVATKQRTVYGLQAYYLRNLVPVLFNYAGADGIKTGYDDKALHSIVATAVRDGKRVYVAIIHAPADYAVEATQMMDYYFANATALASAAVQANAPAPAPPPAAVKPSPIATP